MMQTTTAAMATANDEAVAWATDDARYEAVRARDARADERFVYAVATTGVYCRPSCRARLARRENMAFYATADEAERAGYRACKRCRPREASRGQREAEVVERARRALDGADERVGLAELAERAGVSAYHLHRLFKKHTGLTPREYAAARRMQRAAGGLRAGAPVTSAMYEAGYSSSGRFYEEAGGGALGMRPGDVRRGAEGVAMRAVVASCSLGRVLVAATARGVCAVAFGESADELFEELRERFPKAQVVEQAEGAEGVDAEMGALAARVVAMVEAAGGAAAEVPLDLIGTAFQQRVWKELRAIPAGETRTYAEVARRIGAPKAVRAVGAACGRNPVAVVVPCHRVLRDDGSLGGYRWGLERKARLLAKERKG